MVRAASDGFIFVLERAPDTFGQSSSCWLLHWGCFSPTRSRRGCSLSVPAHGPRGKGDTGRRVQLGEARTPRQFAGSFQPQPLSLTRRSLGIRDSRALLEGLVLLFWKGKKGLCCLGLFTPFLGTQSVGDLGGKPALVLKCGIPMS